MNDQENKKDSLKDKQADTAFEGISFIKSRAVNTDGQKNYAPMFRRRFYLEKEYEQVILCVCGLGIGYYYLNGKKVSEDLFTAPLSDYNKTLWYNEYDVTNMVNKGENIFAAILGNGWYNETIPSVWDFDRALWRDTPKMIVKLTADGETVLTSDEKFKVTIDSPVIFNQLRSGEHFDARLYDSQWNTWDYNDEAWDAALRDTTPPKGVFRRCECEPIQEEGIYPAQTVRKVGDEKYLFDIGQNISGYIRLRVRQRSGDVLKIRYAEQIEEDGSLRLNNMETHYPESEFQTDFFVCCGEEFEWSPQFTYHGFRFIEIDGIENVDKVFVAGVFVHQAIEKRTSFQSSNEFLNELFRAGQISSWSNMFYNLTDCPTREKLGWTNDAQSSTEQMLTNFKAERLFEKWMIDIRDAMKEDGSLPGIIPTAGWGYHWGNGPVSDGILFEAAYRVYTHTGRDEILKNNLPYFKRYLNYLAEKTDRDGKINFGLNDWAAPGQNSQLPVSFVNAVLKTEFLKITALSARLCHEDDSAFQSEYKELKKSVIKEYIGSDQYCVFDEQTAVAMLIYYNLYEELEPLKKQLAKLVEEKDFHHNCGMVGLRRLFLALNKCGLEEYAYRIITAKGYPSFSFWFDGGATSLWEMWEDEQSRNHHMYSDFMSWLIKTVLGIRLNEEKPGEMEFEISPYFFDALSFARGEYNTATGKISVAWTRENSRIVLKINLEEQVKAEYRGTRLKAGENQFIIEKER